MSKSKSGQQKANNDRSNVKNPNNQSHQAAMDNHSNQMNPNHPAHQGKK